MKRARENLEEGEISELSEEQEKGVETEDAEELMQYAILPMQKPAAGGVPMTGEEYLFLVREERSRLPKVATAKVKLEPKALSELIKDELSSLECIVGSKIEDWDVEVLEQFKRDRESWFTYLEDNGDEGCDDDDETKIKLPAINDEQSWNRFLYGRDALEPSQRVVVALGHQARMRLLLYHSRWLAQDDFEFLDSHYSWLYALLCCTPDGLSSEEVSILRTLARSCMAIERTRSFAVSPGCKAIITVVRNHFMQVDLR